MIRDEISFDSPGTWAEINSGSREVMRLKTALVQMMRKDLVSKEAHDQRIQKLTQLSQRVEKLSTLCQERQRLQSTHSDLGLPKLTDLDQNDTTIVNSILDQRLSEVKDTWQNINMMAEWVEDAAKGESSGWRGTVRLGKFKKIVLEQQRREALSDKALEKQTLFIKKVAQRLKSLGTKDFESNFSMLIKLYSHINQLSHRLARIQKKVHDENQTINEMRDWINQRHLALSKQSEMTFPTLGDLKTAISISMSESLNPLEYSRKRLTIAHNFVSQCQEATNPIPPPKKNSKAARKKNKSRKGG